jgi:HlyD family secretion protein
VVFGVTGIGELKATQDADLVFTVQGTVEKVLVKEGDTVKQGDLLAMLDVRIFDQQLQQAEAGLASAQAGLAGLTEAPRSFDARAAQASVNQAAAQLDAVKQGPKAQDIQLAQAGLAATQANLQSTRDRLSAAKTSAEAQMQQAAQALTAAQARYAQAKSNWDYIEETGKDPIQPNVTTSQGRQVANKLSDGARENYYAQFVQAEAAMNQADQALKIAQVQFDTARQTEVSGVEAAQQQANQAQATLDKLLAPPDRAQLAAAQAGLAQAQAAQSRLTAAPREAQQAQAEAGVAQAQAALELAKINREKAELRAPFGGVIATVNIDPGDPSATSGQPAIRIVDSSKLRAEVQVSDTDVVRIKAGHKATLRADAMPDQQFTGTVTFIAPAATVVGTIRTYKVRIDLDSQEGLRAGMSVRVDFPTS